VILASAEEEWARSVGIVMDERLVVIVIILTVMVVTIPALLATVVTCVDIRVDATDAIPSGVPP
jgi:hypothetical protein